MRWLTKMFKIDEQKNKKTEEILKQKKPFERTEEEKEELRKLRDEVRQYLKEQGYKGKIKVVKSMPHNPASNIHLRIQNRKYSNDRKASYDSSNTVNNLMLNQDYSSDYVDIHHNHKQHQND